MIRNMVKIVANWKAGFALHQKVWTEQDQYVELVKAFAKQRGSDLIK